MVLTWSRSSPWDALCPGVAGRALLFMLSRFNFTLKSTQFTRLAKRVENDLYQTKVGFVLFMEIACACFVLFFFSLIFFILSFFPFIFLSFYQNVLKFLHTLWQMVVWDIFAQHSSQVLGVVLLRPPVSCADWPWDLPSRLLGPPVQGHHLLWPWEVTSNPKNSNLSLRNYNWEPLKYEIRTGVRWATWMGHMKCTFT